MFFDSIAKSPVWRSHERIVEAISRTDSHVMATGWQGPCGAGNCLAMEFGPILRTGQIRRCADQVGVLSSSCCQATPGILPFSLQ